MSKSREEITADVLKLFNQLASDWEYAGEISSDMYLFADMGLESLDVVVLGTALQEQYQRVLPFAEFLAEVGERETQDITVGEFVDFFNTHLAEGSIGAQE